MEAEIRFKKSAVLLLAAALVGTVLAAFLPYALEPLLGLAEGLTERGIDPPDRLILLSPWVDVTMSNPEIRDYEGVDPMLTITMGQVSGKAWSGALPTDDWHVSPINGDLSNLHNVTIFVGDRELFTPDDTLLYEKLSANENARLIIGHGQNHVYPVYPTLEGRIAMEQIIDIINRQGEN